MMSFRRLKKRRSVVATTLFIVATHLLGACSGEETPISETSETGSRTSTVTEADTDTAASTDFETNDSTENGSSSSSSATGTATDVPRAEDPYRNRPAGQCAEHSDCPDTANGRYCNRNLPGGSCSGCANDSQCHSGATCSFGTCITDCSEDTDCPAGLYCLGSGRCAAVRCINESCPVDLFSCSSSGQCERESCSTNADCPELTTCIGELCVYSPQ